jgi:GH24 family phage-related lysozyme (muramidase)
MLSDELGMQLHDRETIGEPLTTQEKAQLEAWYAQKDAAETAMLKASEMPLKPTQTPGLPISFNRN